MELDALVLRDDWRSSESLVKILKSCGITVDIVTHDRAKRIIIKPETARKYGIFFSGNFYLGRKYKEMNPEGRLICTSEQSPGKWDEYVDAKCYNIDDESAVKKLIANQFRYFCDE